MSLGTRLETRVNTKDRLWDWKHAHLSSFLYDCIQRVVIVRSFPLAGSRGHHRGLEDSDGLDHTSSRERDLGRSRRKRTRLCSRRPCLPLPGCGGRAVSTLSGGDRISRHVSVNKDMTRTARLSRVGGQRRDKI